MELMELSLVRSLMNKDFYENNRGARCPDKLFSADVRMVAYSKLSIALNLWVMMWQGKCFLACFSRL